VLRFRGRQIAPRDVAAYYPAFDVTPPELVSAYVTHRGAFEHPAALAAWGKVRESEPPAPDGEDA